MILYIVGGIVAAYVLYRYQQGKSTGGTGTSDGTTGAGYSQLAGQEQSDTAALQNAEQSDIAKLTADLQALAGQNQADIGALSSQETGDLGAVTANEAALLDRINGLATGTHKPSDVTVHAGGPFSKFYTAVTGRKPPKTVSPNDFLYQAWRSGVHASQLKGTVSHNHHPHKNGGSVAPSDHGKKPAKTGRPAGVGVKVAPGTFHESRKAPAKHPARHKPAKKRR